jgi:hypothetical protein
MSTSPIASAALVLLLASVLSSAPSDPRSGFVLVANQ